MQSPNEEFIKDPDALRYADRPIVESDWELPSLVFFGHDILLRNDQIQKEFRRARSGIVQTEYSPSGKYLECFANVLSRVASEGGSPCLGWQITPHMRFSDGVHLEAHCVWQNATGRLVEVTPSRHTWRFAPSDGVRLGAKMVITSETKSRAKTLTNRSTVTVGIWTTVRNDLAP